MPRAIAEGRAMQRGPVVSFAKQPLLPLTEPHFSNANGGVLVRRRQGMGLARKDRRREAKPIIEKILREYFASAPGFHQQEDNDCEASRRT